MDYERVSGKFDLRFANYLADLASPDRKIRQRAFDWLDNNAVLQGALCDAAFEAVAPLQQLLRKHEEAEVRVLCYKLLYEIHNGHASEIQTAEVEPGRFIPLMDACQLAVEEQFDSYVRDITSGHADLRFEAVDLLVSFEALADRVEAVLQDALAFSNDPGARANLERGLRELHED